MAYGFNEDKSKYELGSEVLWTNPDPNDAFVAQSITLSESLSEYAFFEVLFKRTNLPSGYGGADNYYGSTGKLPVSASGFVMMSGKYIKTGTGTGNMTTTLYVREGSITNNTTIAFALAGYMQRTGGQTTSASAGESDNHCVPYQVIGHRS